MKRIKQEPWKRKQLADIVRGHAKKSYSKRTKCMLHFAADSLEEIAKKEAEKRGIREDSVFHGVKDPEALACFFFDLLLMHDASFELREILVSIAEEISEA